MLKIRVFNRDQQVSLSASKHGESTVHVRGTMQWAGNLETTITEGKLSSLSRSGAGSSLAALDIQNSSSLTLGFPEAPWVLRLYPSY